MKKCTFCTYFILFNTIDPLDAMPIINDREFSIVSVERLPMCKYENQHRDYDYRKYYILNKITYTEYE